MGSMALRGINCIFLLGTVRREPESLTSRTGKEYAKLELDVTTVRRQGNGVEEAVTEIVTVTVFGKLGEIVTRYVHRGDPIHITAHVSSSEFRTSSGETKRSVSILADSIQLLPNGRREG
jgi:single-strand DNA-binding protein